MGQHLRRVGCALLTIGAAVAQAQSLTTLANFTGGTNKPNELFQASDGNFYGVTKNIQDSIVFQLTPAGALNTLLTEDVQSIASSLVQGADGNFYGTSAYNGSNYLGTLFKLTPARILTTLHQFQGTDGADPIGGLLLASDGNFYGTTNQGGTVRVRAWEWVRAPFSRSAQQGSFQPFITSRDRMAPLPPPPWCRAPTAVFMGLRKTAARAAPLPRWDTPAAARSLK